MKGEALVVLLPFDSMIGFTMVALGLIMMLPDVQRSKSNSAPGQAVPLQYVTTGGVMFLMGVGVLISQLMEVM